jgi:LysR family transcriptional regulator, glycine cleavage system transcriptional activator
MSDELTQIVILPPCADNGLAIAEDREIPFLRNPEGYSAFGSRSRPGELDRWLAAYSAGKTNGERQSFGHFCTAYEAALACDGLLIAPMVLAAEDVRNGRLVSFKPHVRLQGARHVLLWRNADEAGTELMALAAWLRQ